jgi:hypothetical protein
MNIEGLTNRQVLVRALRRLVNEVETGLVSAEALEWARAALGEVVRNKRPESLPKLKPTKKVQF